MSDQKNWAQQFSIVLACMAWIAIFTMGVHVPAEPHVSRMINPENTLDWFNATLIVMFVYTRANFGWLCLIGAFIGSQSAHGKLSFLKAMTYGFLVYQLALAGLLIFSKGNVGLPSQEQYIYYASLASIFSFLVCYNPSLFETFVQRVSEGFKNVGTNADEDQT
jgi:hypothetical protein